MVDGKIVFEHMCAPKVMPDLNDGLCLLFTLMFHKVKRKYLCPCGKYPGLQNYSKQVQTPIAQLCSLSV